MVSCLRAEDLVGGGDDLGGLAVGGVETDHDHGGSLGVGPGAGTHVVPRRMVARPQVPSEMSLLATARVTYWSSIEPPEPEAGPFDLATAKTMAPTTRITTAAATLVVMPFSEQIWAQVDHGDQYSGRGRRAWGGCPLRRRGGDVRGTVGSSVAWSGRLERGPVAGSAPRARRRSCRSARRWARTPRAWDRASSGSPGMTPGASEFSSAGSPRMGAGCSSSGRARRGFDRQARMQAWFTDTRAGKSGCPARPRRAARCRCGSRRWS